MNCTPKTWQAAIERLRHQIPEFAYASWIAPLSIKLAPDRVVLGCPSSFHRDHVRIVYSELLESLVREVLKDNDAAALDTEASDCAGAADRKTTFSETTPSETTPSETTPSETTSSETTSSAAHSAGCGSGRVFPKVEVLGMPQFADAPGTMFEIQTARGSEDQTEMAPQAEQSVQQAGGNLRLAPRRGSQRNPESAEPTASEPSQPAPGALDSARPGASAATPASASPLCKPTRQAASQPLGRPLSSPPAAAAGNRPGTGSVTSASRRSGPGKRGEHQAQRHAAKAETEPTRREIPQGPSGFQPELPFSFDNFVVGPCNALAREAALALARRQQQSLNMLYLGGESGMGKTHLARATAEAARPTQRLAAAAAAGGGRPQLRSGHPGTQPKPGHHGVVYTSAEEFTTEFVSAMRNGRADSFRRRYRGATGLLVVEDIQFFSGRVKTQLELFHTVQHVLDAGGSVMMTGDRSPRELTGLDDRIRTQVARGFIAELEPPDALVRRHILRSKAAAGGVRLPADCLNLLVDASHGSVRDIEGMLIQVVTTASLLGRDIDMGLTREAIDLKTSVSSSLTKKTVAVTEIVRIVAGFFGKKPEALAAKSRRRDVLVPRQLAMYLAHRYTDASLAEIGRSLGRGHPSVRNAIERVDRQILENAPIRYKLEALCERIDRTLSLDGAGAAEPGPAD